jgi:hypothetical protein
MKKNILNKVLITFIVTLSYTISFAQLYVDKDFFIGNTEIVYVKGIQLQFSAASTTTTTTRTVTTYGKLWMNAEASLATIDVTAPTTPFPSASHFMDGYVRSDRTTQFLYPVGQSGVIGFAATTAATTDPIDVAFFRANASTSVLAPALVAGTKGPSVTNVSTVEYWDMIGTNSTRISLTWRASSSSFSTLGVTLPSHLSIVGLNKSNNTWEIIPSTIDATSILTGTSDVTTSGSITSNANVNLATYRYFTFAKKGNCSPVLANTGGTTIWTGSWDNGTPDDTKTAQINILYSGDSFTCNSLVLNANVDLTGGKFIDCVNGVSGPGFVIMDTDADFLQRNASSVAPNIKMKKIISQKRLNDWTYFGSPLANGELTAMQTAKCVGTGTLTGAYFNYRIWRHGISNDVTNWFGVLSNTSSPSYLTLAATEAEIVPGMGFIAKVKYQIPFISLTTKKDIVIDIDGLSNNGNITRTTSSTILNNTMSTVLLGNPYPSTIDADLFLDENPNINGAIHFWSARSEYVGVTGTIFNPGQDFVTYTKAGGVGSISGAPAPNRYISSAQGFNVTTAVASQPIYFNNCMRVTNGIETIFHRNSNATESKNNNSVINRFWVNISNATNEFYNEALIAYIPETTLGYDRLYDAITASTSEYKLTSLLNNENYSIQSRSDFNPLDVVTMNVKKASTYSGNMKISISNKEGIFNTDEVTIYLHDKQLNVFHNLEMSDYTFTLNEIENSSRFDIIYQTTALNTQNFDLNTVNITLFNNDFKVISKDLIEDITIYDVSGRLIQSYKEINKTDFTSNFNHEGGIYIAKVKLENGNVTSQKITNLNK